MIDPYKNRRNYWPAYTWPIQTSYLAVMAKNEKNILDRLGNIDKEELISHASDLFNKVNATFYHLQQLKLAEKNAIDLGLKLSKTAPIEFKNSIGVVGSPYEPISYEYESLLINAKSSLDILTITISECLKRKEDNIISLSSNLIQTKRLSILESKIKDVLIKHNDFIKTFGRDVSKRNYAVHKGVLPVGTINVPINNPNGEIIKSKAYNHNENIKNQLGSVLKVENLEDYVENVFYSMADIVVDCLEILLDTKFEKGQRKSVADLRTET